MSIGNKVQIEVIKNGKYMAGKVNNTILFSNGQFICYVSEESCLIDISKIKELPMDGREKFSEDKIRETMIPIELTNEALIFSDRTIQLFENMDNRIWIDSKYVKMFKDYDYYSAYIEDGTKVIVFTKCEKIVGLVLPAEITEKGSGNESKI